MAIVEIMAQLGWICAGIPEDARLTLAIHCRDEKEGWFQGAAMLCQDALGLSSVKDVEPDRTAEQAVQVALRQAPESERFDVHTEHFDVVCCRSLQAIGIGSTKEKRKRAACFALAITAAIDADESKFAIDAVRRQILLVAHRARSQPGIFQDFDVSWEESAPSEIVLRESDIDTTQANQTRKEPEEEADLSGDQASIESEFIPFFRGPIGSSHVFAHFEDDVSTSLDDGHFLQRLPSACTTQNTKIRASVWGGLTRGTKSVVFRVDEATLQYLRDGVQGRKWRNLRDIRNIGNSASALPSQIWTGRDINLGWILGCSNKPNRTFASSYAYNSDWDRCDGSPLIGGESVELSYAIDTPTKACRVGVLHKRVGTDTLQPVVDSIFPRYRPRFHRARSEERTRSWSRTQHHRRLNSQISDDEANSWTTLASSLRELHTCITTESLWGQVKEKKLHVQLSMPARCRQCLADAQDIVKALERLQDVLPKGEIDPRELAHLPGWEAARKQVQEVLESRLQAPSKTIEVPIQDMRYTQRKASHFFKHGVHQDRTVESVKEDLLAGRIRIDADEMTLDAVRWHGAYYSLNNRHLKALTMYLQEVPKEQRPQKKAKLRIWPLTPGLHLRHGRYEVVDKFRDCFSSRDYGRSLSIRQRRRRRSDYSFLLASELEESELEERNATSGVCTSAANEWEMVD